MVTTTPGNWRNASGTQCPPLFTSVDRTFQSGVLIKVSDWNLLAFRRNLLTGQIEATKDLGTIPALVSYGITPIKSDALGGDVHYGACTGLDDRHRQWIAGNSLAETPHLIRTTGSAATSLATWTTFTWPYPGFGATGGPYCTYQNFQRLSTGQLILHIDQRDVGGAAEGKDNLAYILPLGSDTWQPLVGTGEILTSEPATGPQRVYLSGCFVEQYPHKDRAWISFIYRTDWTAVTSQFDLGVIYNDTITNSATWKRIDGTTQPMPVSYSNVTGTSALIPLPAGQTYWNLTGQMSVDRQGHPHFITGPGGANRHVWHDGTTWQYQTVSTGSTTPAPFTLRNGNTLLYREFGGRVRVSNITSGAPTFDLGYPVPSNWDQPYADPIQLAEGNLHLLVPNGDIPEVFTFGEASARLRAS